MAPCKEGTCTRHTPGHKVNIVASTSKEQRVPGGSRQLQQDVKQWQDQRIKRQHDASQRAEREAHDMR